MAMRTKPVLKLDNKNLAEIFQKNLIKFAFVKETPDHYEQQHSMVLCRDFLLDVLFAEDQKTPFQIYKFLWDPEEQQIDRDATKLYVTFANTGQLRVLQKNLHIIHTFEKENHLKRTQIKVQEDKKSAVIIASSLYLKKSWALSFYTFLLKVFAIGDSFEEATSVEGDYVSNVGVDKIIFLMENFREMLKQKSTTVSGVNATEPDYIIHDNAGWVALCTGKCYNKLSKNFSKLWEGRKEWVGHNEESVNAM